MRLRQVSRAGALVSVATVLANLMAYLVPLAAARLLQPTDFSVIATILAICAVASVPGLGLQMAVAVDRARHGRNARLGRLAWSVALLTGAVVFAASPLLATVFRLPWASVALAAALVVPPIIGSRWAGELQGGLRFGRLAIAMVLLAVARNGGILLGLAIGLDVTGSLAVGVAVAIVAVAAVGWVTPRGRPAESARGIVRELAAATSAILIMTVAAAADLLAARYLLPPDQAAGYAVLSVLAKGALWAPQVVTVLALPLFARGSRRTRLLAPLAVLASGVVLVGLAASFSQFAVRLVGGPAYSHLAHYAPAFAAVGALYAVVFVLINAQIAERVRLAAAPLWLAAGGFVVALALSSSRSIGVIVGWAIATAAVTATAVAIRGASHSPGVGRTSVDRTVAPAQSV